MVSGHLREQNGMFQMVLTWKDSSGKRRSKSLSTGLAVKGNKTSCSITYLHHDE